MKKKMYFAKSIAIAATIASMSLLPGCSSGQDSTPQQMAETTTNEPAISGFCDQAWGADLAAVKSVVITSSMQENTDYTLGEEQGYYILGLNSSEVGGHAAAASYTFQDDKLVMGGYQLEMDDNAFSDLLQKYTAKYGEPAAHEEDTGWGPCAVWVDSNKNYICISSFMDSIVYVSSGCSITDNLADTLSEYQGINLKSLLNQAGNSKGV